MALPKEAAILDFTPSGSKDQKILWSRINAEDTRGARGTISGNRWTASTMRFADTGRYTLLRESGCEISSITAKVGGRERYHDVDMHGSLEYRIGLPVSEAVVTFIDPWNKQHVIFKNGMMTEDSFRIFEDRVRISINTKLDVLQFEMSGANSKMIGRYEFTEKKGRAFVYHVHGKSNEPPTIPDRILPIALAAGILTLFTFCCCVRRCCCKKKESSSPAPASSSLPVYIHEPAPGPRPAYQPAARGPVGGTIDTPAAPSYNSSPPSYDALSANGPEPYVPYVPYAPPEAPTGAYGAPSAPDYQYQPSGWSMTDILNTSPLSMGTTDTRAPDGAGAAPAATPTPTVPSAPSAPDYQYQPRGWTGTTGDFLTVSPLNTDTTDHTEYSSAKLNF
ncbi:uncharacterized protein LOC134440116 [Engraulis encrasicolus]|uniref:uncharacterized protein LOC134440116 n=1 Tax=Engraulis encrasicolus TaxID=184585 RepID=UPI002FD255B3